MGTHPIFESDFDCLTDFAIMVNAKAAAEISAYDTQKTMGKEMKFGNPHLSDDIIDILYHLGLDTSDLGDIKQRFGDVKFVCMGGSRGRVVTLARLAAEELKDHYPISPEAATTDIARKAGRFVMYKIGPILTLNHGMGFGSLSIALHEVAKLLQYAGATNFCFVRMGTSGGLGADPGNVIITKEGYDATLEPGYEVTSCGKKRRYPAVADAKLISEFVKSAKDLEIPVQIGNTIGCDDFYESQCRLDGALCDYTEQDKFDFIRKAYNDHGVLNMEMEANVFLSFCNRLKIPGAVVCCSIVNRLKGDQITSTKEFLKAIERYPLAMILQAVKNRCS